MLKNIIITDKTIMAYQAKVEVTELRCEKYKELKIRFHKNRTKASWVVWYKSAWLKVGNYPTVKTKDIRAALPDLLMRLHTNKRAKVSSEEFKTVSDLLKWYQKRMTDNANMSKQRIKDIKSAVKCHLMPKLGDALVYDLTLAVLDKRLIWVSQKELAPSTVLKHFAMLKAAYKDAYDLQIIKENPLATIKLGDFGSFKINPKEGQIKPKMVKELLECVIEQKPIAYVMTMVMLTLGNRLGETRSAKWQDIHLNNDPEWNIPARTTKTKKGHDIKLPEQLAELLRKWKAYQAKRHYKGGYVFPNAAENGEISSNEASALFRVFSKKKWASHDLRKCARTCWLEQGVDYAIGEKMVNHSLGKLGETYTNIGETAKLRHKGLINHANWLVEQCNICFNFDEVMKKTNKR